MTQKVDVSSTRPQVSAARSGRPLALPFSERRLLLGTQDLLAVNGALLLSLALHPEYGHAWPRSALRPEWFILLSGLWLLLAHVSDAYNLRVAGRLSTAAAAVAKAGLLTAIAFDCLPLLTPSLPASRLALVAFPLLAVGLLVAGRSIYVLALTRPPFQRRALIVGAGWAGRTLAETLANWGAGACEVVGFVDDDAAKMGKAVGDCRECEDGAPLLVLGDRHALPGLIKERQVTTLVLAITHEINGTLLQTLLDCLEMGVEIIPMPLLYEQLTGRVPISHIGGHWDVAMPIQHPGTGALWPLAKRLMDIALASAGLVSLGVLLPFIALAIYLDSPGPIFYEQARVGKGGRVFTVLKLRSMVVDAENGEALWAQKDDPRVTRVGRLLRRAHLDEWPQFFNILKGEMSLVGPRPERPEIVAKLAAEIPFYRVRHAIKPGAAGWALVKQGYGASREDALLKLQYDLYYIKHQSLTLDLVILFKAIIDTLTRGGR